MFMFKWFKIISVAYIAVPQKPRLPKVIFAERARSGNLHIFFVLLAGYKDWELTDFARRPSMVEI